MATVSAQILQILLVVISLPGCLTLSRTSSRNRASALRGGAKAAISCFTCYSYNGSDSSCSDPFHPAYAKLAHNCKQGWEGRAGVFPAKYCIKVKGVNWEDGAEMIVRSCGMKSMDNMCGHFRFGEMDYQGCMMSCNSDACNKGQQLTSACLTLLALILTFICLLRNI